MESKLFSRLFYIPSIKQLKVDVQCDLNRCYLFYIVAAFLSFQPLHFKTFRAKNSKVLNCVEREEKNQLILGLKNVPVFCVTFELLIKIQKIEM